MWGAKLFNVNSLQLIAFGVMCACVNGEENKAEQLVRTLSQESHCEMAGDCLKD